MRTVRSRPPSSPPVFERGASRMLPEEAHERGGGREVQGLGDLQYGQIGCSQAAFGLDQCRFVEPFECGMSRGLLDGGREPFGGDAEPVGIEGDLPLRLEVLRHELEETAGEPLLARDLRTAGGCGGRFDLRDDDQQKREQQGVPDRWGLFVVGVVSFQQGVEGGQIRNLFCRKRQPGRCLDMLEPVESEGDGQRVEVFGRYEQQFDRQVRRASCGREQVPGQTDEHLVGRHAEFAVVDPEEKTSRKAEAEDDAVEERRLADPLLRVSAGEVHERKITQFQLFGPDFSYILHLFCGLIRGEYTKNCTFSGRVG